MKKFISVIAAVAVLLSMSCFAEEAKSDEKEAVVITAAEAKEDAAITAADGEEKDVVPIADTTEEKPVGDGEPAAEPAKDEKKAEKTEITVKIDGTEIKFDQPPILVNDRTMVPLRAIFEGLKAVVTWENDTNTAIAFKDDTTISVQIDNNKMFKNSEVIELDAAPVLVNDRTLVPVRAISEAFNCKVDWDEKNLEVIITTADEKETVVDENKEEVKDGETAADDKKDEAAADEAKADEVKADETKADETKADDKAADDKAADEK